MPDVTSWADLGAVGVLTAALVYLFLGMRSLMREVMEWSGNHLSETVKSQVKLTEAITRLVGQTSELTEQVRRLEHEVRWR
jgi:predicted nuclease with TOPRIM domain